MKQTLRIATRQSKLALWQANYVKQALETAHNGLQVEIMGMTTQGDQDKSTPLARLGGKGVFVKELESALLDERADIAVHSMKDVPSVLPQGLLIAAICEREDPRDAFVSHQYQSFETLPAGAKVGSSSLRRRLQMQARRPDLEYLDVRGNVETRLRKLDSGEFDGIILAVAGLKRLGLADRITQAMTPDDSTPSAGQGAVGIEARSTDVETLALLAAINHRDTFDCVSCERTVSTKLGASCELPVAAFATLDGDTVSLQAYVGSVTKHIRQSGQSDRVDAVSMAEEVTQALLSSGAAEILAS